MSRQLDFLHTLEKVPSGKDETGRRPSTRVRLFRVVLYPHDPLWFSSVEFGGQVITDLIVHPYALSFAMANSGRVFGRDDAPDYEADLPPDLYCLAAEGPALRRIRLTYNAVDDVTRQTDTEFGGSRNTPMMGTHLCVEPSLDVGYDAYLFTKNGSVPRAVVRLGKKRAAMRVTWKEIPMARLRRMSEAIEATHLVNPLDIAGDLQRFVPVPMAPHLLLRQAAIANDLFVITDDGQRIHVPKRVSRWLG